MTTKWLWLNREHSTCVRVDQICAIQTWVNDKSRIVLLSGATVTADRTPRELIEALS